MGNLWPWKRSTALEDTEIQRQLHSKHRELEDRYNYLKGEQQRIQQQAVNERHRDPVNAVGLMRRVHLHRRHCAQLDQLKTIVTSLIFEIQQQQTIAGVQQVLKQGHSELAKNLKELEPGGAYDITRILVQLQQDMQRSNTIQDQLVLQKLVPDSEQQSIMEELDRLAANTVTTTFECAQEPLFLDDHTSIFSFSAGSANEFVPLMDT